jgi:dsDNA-specific endonuclease/ATPase MutS2
MSEPGDDPVEVPLTDALDLHAFQPRDVKDLVTHYLDEAQAKGYREVRVIHGRGVGVQREIVRSILARHPKVVSYADAPPERGGWGATIVRLAEPPVGV